MKTIEIKKMVLTRDNSILENMDRFVDWNMSAHPLANLIKISNGGAFVARIHESNIGMIFAFPYDYSVGWIAFLVIDPKYRKKGIGTALMNKAISFLRSKNIKSIGLYATNEGAPLYERMGFVKSLISTRFTVVGDDELILLRKKLLTMKKSSSFNLVEFSDPHHYLLNQVILLDQTIFKANRNLIFTTRLGMGSWNCTCTLKDDTVVAFGMWRLIGDSFGFIGPLAGLESPIFQDILPRIIIQLVEKGASSIYIGTNSNIMKEWLISHGFSLGEQPLLMFLGKKPELDDQMWAICHPSKG